MKDSGIRVKLAKQVGRGPRRHSRSLSLEGDRPKSLRAISETLRQRGFWFKTRRGCAVLLPVRQEITTPYWAKNTLSPMGLRPKMPTTVSPNAPTLVQILVRTWAITCDLRLVVNIFGQQLSIFREGPEAPSEARCGGKPDRTTCIRWILPFRSTSP